MSITRSLLATLTLLPLVTACQVYTGKPEGPPPATRLQGEVQVQNGALLFTPCQEQRHFSLSGSGIEREAMNLLAGNRSSLFADLAGELGGSQGQGSDGRFEVSRVYRLQAEGHGCDDLNFKRLVLRASGNEPAWQVEVGSKGLVLNRPNQPPLALPYLEEQLPDERISFSSEANGQRLELWVAPQRCVDSMSGTLNHLSAELRLDGQVLRGCAHFGGMRN
ncbi:COG3650 family protein [Pseudomonas sp. NCHU5208]|uniref:COG3650 family protein n=1 Tax=unclassified Pseudomonas TaxID=196821 RepID=UPI003F9C1F40